MCYGECKYILSYLMHLVNIEIFLIFGWNKTTFVEEVCSSTIDRCI